MIKNRMLSRFNPAIEYYKAEITCFLWRDEEERKLVLEYCYTSLQKKHWEAKKIESLTKKFGFDSRDEVLELAYLYLKEELHSAIPYETFLDFVSLKEKDAQNEIELLSVANPLFPDSFVNWRNKEERDKILNYCYETFLKSQNDFSVICNLARSFGFEKENKVLSYIRLYETEFTEENSIESDISESLEEIKKMGAFPLSKPNPVLKKLGLGDVYLSWRDESECRQVCSSCYYFLKRALYQCQYISKLASLFGVENRKVLKMARIYALKYLGMSDSKYREEKFLLQSRVCYPENTILRNLGIPGIKRNWENQEQREKVLKYCYELCVKLKWNKEELEEKQLELNFDYDYEMLQRYAKVYALEFLKMSEQEFQFQRSVVKFPVMSTLYQIYLEEDYEKIMEIVDTSFYSASYLKSRIVSFEIFCSKNKYLIDVVPNLEKKLNYFLQMEKVRREEAKAYLKQRELELMGDEARNAVENYIQCSLTITEFCVKKQISEEDFKNYLKIVKEHFPVLHEKYLEKDKKEKARRFAILRSQCQRILDQMKYGVEEADSVRPFDLIDFYQMYRGSFDEFSRICMNGITEEDRLILRKFQAKYQSDSAFPLKQILPMHIEYDLQKDEQGNILPGSGKVLTVEDKMQIVNALQEAHIPVTRNTFQLARLRFQKNELDLIKLARKK